MAALFAGHAASARGAEGAAGIEAACGRLYTAVSAAPSTPPHAAVMQAVKVDPERTTWEEIEQPFWPGYRVYRIHHGLPPLRELVAAVDRDGRAVVRLTNDRPVSREQRARRCFNAVARSQGLSLEGDALAAYAGFFLGVHRGRPGHLLWGQEDVLRVSRTAGGSFAEEALLAELAEVPDAGFDVIAAEGGARAVAYDWEPDRGFVYAYDLRLTRDGVIEALSQTLVAKQPDDYRTTRGTCFAVSGDGLVVTARHVVRGAGSRVTVRLADRRELPARLLQVWRRSDLALLAVGGETSGYLELARPGEIQAGQEIFAVAFPPARKGGWEPALATGAVTALSDPGGDAARVHTTLPVRGGNSGAPMVSTAGKVLAVLLSSEEVWPNGGPRQLYAVGAPSYPVRDALPAAPGLSAAPDREAAIERARAAVCEVEGLADEELPQEQTRRRRERALRAAPPPARRGADRSRPSAAPPAGTALGTGW